MIARILKTLFSVIIHAGIIVVGYGQENSSSAPEPFTTSPSPGASATNQPAVNATEPIASNDVVRDADDRFEGTWDLIVNYRRPLNGDYEALSQAMTSVSYMLNARDLVSLELSGGVLELKRGTFASAVARDPLVLEGGFSYRHCFTEPQAFIRPYVSLNFDWFVFIWDYREPIELEDHTLHMDYAWGIDPSVGLGITLQPTKRLNVFGEINVGGMITPGSETERGVENDFFDDFGYIGLRAGLRLKF